MYRIQKKYVPPVTTYLGVYSIRSRLSRTVRPLTIEQTTYMPAQIDTNGSEEDPFPHSTRPYGKRLEVEQAFQWVPLTGNRLYTGFNTLDVAVKNPDIVVNHSLPEQIEPGRHKGFMLSLQHIYALVKRYLLIKVRDITRIANLTYFPIADIILAGFISFWMQRHSATAQLDNMIYMLELSFWLIINSTHIESCFNFIEELQTRNLSNLFSSSLLHFEWVAASSLLSFIEASLAACVCGLVLYFVYGINFLILGWFFPVFLFLSFLSGWIMAVLTISLLINKGLRLTIMSLALPYIVMSLCAAYYPLEVLPAPIQMISRCVPTTYMYEALRALVIDHVIPYNNLLISLILHGIYIILALLLYNFMFKRSMDQGLARIENE